MHVLMFEYLHGFQTHEDRLNFSPVLDIYIVTCSNKHEKSVCVSLQTTHAKCVINRSYFGYFSYEAKIYQFLFFSSSEI
jgi:hypothetical protein